MEEKTENEKLKESLDIWLGFAKVMIGIIMIPSMTIYYLYVRPFPQWLILIPVAMAAIDFSGIKKFFK